MSFQHKQLMMLGVVLVAIALPVIADIWAGVTDVELTYSRMTARTYMTRQIAVIAVLAGLFMGLGHMLFPQYLRMPCPHCAHCRAAVQAGTASRPAE